MKRTAITLLLLTGLSACATGMVNLKNLSPKETEGYRAVRILNDAQLLDRDFEVLGIVEGHSCRSNMLGSAPSRTAAVEQARYAAYKLGANAIANINYADPEGTSASCWESISITAEAVKLATPPPDVRASTSNPRSYEMEFRAFERTVRSWRMLASTASLRSFPLRPEAFLRIIPRGWQGEEIEELPRPNTGPYLHVGLREPVLRIATSHSLTLGYGNTGSPDWSGTALYDDR